MQLWAAGNEERNGKREGKEESGSCDVVEKQIEPPSRLHTPSASASLVFGFPTVRIWHLARTEFRGGRTH